MSISKASIFVMFFIVSMIISKFKIEKDCTDEGYKVNWLVPYHTDHPRIRSIDFPDLFRKSGNELGRGSFGVVRKVSIAKSMKLFDNINKHDLAVKRVTDTSEITAELEIFRLLDESKAVPKFYACIISKSRQSMYIVQQMLSQTLEHLSVRTAILQKSKLGAIHFFKSGFEGINDMEKAGLIHNDIKPANLMTDADVSKVYLIDFGLSQLTKNTKSNKSGSPVFMSFERTTQTEHNIINDYYSYALSIAVVYSNINAVFKTIFEGFSDKTKSIIPQECYKYRSNYPPPGYLSLDHLQDFCLAALKHNAVEALKDTFGEEQKKAKNDALDLNFTTLIAKIIDFKHSLIQPSHITKALENLLNENAIDTPSTIMFDPEELEKSSKLIEERIELYNKNIEFEPVKHVNKKLSDAQALAYFNEREKFYQNFEIYQEKETADFRKNMPADYIDLVERKSFANEEFQNAEFQKGNYNVQQDKDVRKKITVIRKIKKVPNNPPVNQFAKQKEQPSDYNFYPENKDRQNDKINRQNTLNKNIPERNVSLDKPILNQKPSMAKFEQQYPNSPLEIIVKPNELNRKVSNEAFNSPHPPQNHYPNIFKRVENTQDPLTPRNNYPQQIYTKFGPSPQTDRRPRSSDQNEHLFQNRERSRGPSDQMLNGLREQPTRNFEANEYYAQNENEYKPQKNQFRSPDIYGQQAFYKYTSPPPKALNQRFKTEYNYRVRI